MTQYGKYPNAFYRLVVKTIIKNTKDQILLVKENSDDWDLPGGGIDHGETVQDALKRELAEEISYNGAIDTILLGTQPIYSKRADICVMFVVYSVTLRDPYEPRAGADASVVEYRDLPDSPAGLMTRSDELMYKFAVDPSYMIDFLPK